MNVVTCWCIDSASAVDAAVVGEFADHHRCLADRRPHAAELGRHGEGEEAGVAEVLEGLLHPRALGVVAGGVLGENRAEAGRPSDELGLACLGVLSLNHRRHDAIVPNDRPANQSIFVPTRYELWTLATGEGYACCHA